MPEQHEHIDSDPLRRLAGTLDVFCLVASPGPWKPYFETSSDPLVVYEDEQGWTRRVASVSYDTPDYGQANAHLLAQAPTIARVLAVMLRALDEQWNAHIGGQALATADACVCNLCEYRRAVLAAIEPLTPEPQETP